MQPREEIFNQFKNILIEKFEIDEALIHPQANLYEDLGLDSIDAVDMMLNIKEITGKKMKPEDFKNTRTIEDVVDAIAALIGD